jgi:hypothetical protein
MMHAWPVVGTKDAAKGQHTASIWSASCVGPMLICAIWLRRHAVAPLRCMIEQELFAKAMLLGMMPVTEATGAVPE